MKAAITVATINTKATSSTPGKVSEIQSLTDRSDRLAKSIEEWNAGYIWLGAIALLVAFAVFFSQWRIIRKGVADCATF